MRVYVVHIFTVIRENSINKQGYFTADNRSSEVLVRYISYRASRY